MPRNLSWAAFVAATALLAATPARAGDAAAKFDAAAAGMGGVIYERYCGACHGTSGEGDGALAKDLRVPPTDLTLLAKKKGGVFPYVDVVRSIDGRRSARAHGTPDMPVWGEVLQKSGGTDAPDVDTAVARIAHYIWSIQKK
jgi:mono/diheme cytochrome c family protein